MKGELYGSFKADLRHLRRPWSNVVIYVKVSWYIYIYLTTSTICCELLSALLCTELLTLNTHNSPLCQSWPHILNSILFRWRNQQLIYNYGTMRGQITLPDQHPFLIQEMFSASNFTRISKKLCFHLKHICISIVPTNC